MFDAVGWTATSEKDEIGGRTERADSLEVTALPALSAAPGSSSSWDALTDVEVEAETFFEESRQHLQVCWNLRARKGDIILVTQ